MKQKNIIFSFIPWIVFSAGLTSFLNAAISAFVLNIIIARKDLLRGIVLEIGGVLFFGAMIFLGLFLSHADTFTQHPNLWSNIAMTVIMLGSVVINKPFTGQYTDQGTLEFHRRLSAIWGCLLLLATFISLAHAYFGLSNTMSTLGTIVAILIGIKANTFYPKIYIENVKKKLMEKNKSNVFLQGNYAPVKDELNVENLKVIGKIPDDLLGVYMRNGPNPAFPPISYTYPFDGDGMIHAVYIKNGKARYKNRFVETPELLTERRAGKSLYSGLKMILPPDTKFVGENVSPVKQGNFIHIIHHANKYLALHEGSPAYEMTSELKTLGLWCPVGSEKPISISPHTRLCPTTGDLWLIQYDLEPPYLSIYRVDKTGRLQFKKEIDKPYSTMMHDFTLTENYVIFFDCPLVFDLKNVGTGKDILEWRQELGTRIGIMSRQTSELKWFETESFFVFHFANAYENNQKIIIDFVQHSALSLTSLSDIKVALPMLYRMTIDLSNNTIKNTPLDDRIVEFPRIKEAVNSQKHQFIYLPSEIRGHHIPDAFDALIKYDVDNNTSDVHDFGQHCEIDEAVFVPRKNASSEDDGYLMLFVYNKNENNSELVILDAQNMKDELLARIKMPRRVPHGLHGSWMNGPWQ